MMMKSLQLALLSFLVVDGALREHHNSSFQDDDNWVEHQKALMYEFHGIYLPAPHLSNNSGATTTTAQGDDDSTAITVGENTASRLLRRRKKRQNRHHLQLPGKKGIAITLRPEGQDGSWVENLPKVIAVNPYWNYNWGPYRIEQQPNDIEFVPMIWGAWNKKALRQLVNTAVQPHVDDGTTQRLLGFNEPDNIKQANMKVKSAIFHWRTLQAVGVPLASPAAVDATGKWMKKFYRVATRKNRHMDYLAVHWYGGPNVATFKHRMEQVYEHYDGKPLLITEFASADWNAQTVADNRFSRSQVLAFMKDVLPWLEAQDWVYGYAWFPFKASFPPGTCSSLFEEDGSLTPLGRYYASVRSDRPDGDQSIQV